MKKPGPTFEDAPLLDLEEEGPLAEESRPVPLIDAFRTIVEARRSVRSFKAEAVPEHVVKDCLDLALLAPNSSNLQCWEFHWVRSAPRKAELVKACLDQSAARTAAELIVCVARTATWRENRQRMLLSLQREHKTMPHLEAVRAYYETLVPILYGQGPWGIFGPFKKVFLWTKGFFGATPREPCGNAEMRTWAVKSTALACENLMLAFSAHGYDSCPMEGFDSARIRNLLSLPGDAVVVMVVAAGRRAADGVRGPRIRFDRRNYLREY